MPSCSHLQSHHCPIMPTSLLQLPWAVPEEACLSIRSGLSPPLAWAILLLVPTFETGLGGSFSPRASQNSQNCRQRLRPVGVMKVSSSVGAMRRSAGRRHHQCGQVQPWSRLRRRQSGRKNSTGSLEVKEGKKRTDAGAHLSENPERRRHAVGVEEGRRTKAKVWS